MVRTCIRNGTAEIYLSTGDEDETCIIYDNSLIRKELFPTIKEKQAWISMEISVIETNVRHLANEEKQHITECLKTFIDMEVSNT